LAVAAFIIVVVGYHPPSKKSDMTITDYVGLFLPIAGIAGFILGLQWGGYN